MNMLPRIILSIFIVVEILTWRRAADGRPHSNSERGQKYCPDLVKPDHGEIINGKCKKAKAGGICEFKCDEGYRLDGNALSVCTSDNLKWSTEPPKCIKDEKYCPDLEKPDHGEIIDGKCKKAKGGDYCKFECRGEYRLDGDALLFCSSDNLEWSHRPPKCIKVIEEKYCADLQKPDNGEINGQCQKAKAGEECTFKCNQDYRLEGGALLFCGGEKLEWSNGPPKCIQVEKYCSDLEKPDNGEINGKCKQAKPGEYCKFECSGDYSLDGTALIFCRSDNLEWSHGPPKCIKVIEEKYCPDPEKPANGAIINGDCKKATAGESCKFECNADYHLDGTAILVCIQSNRSENLEWSHGPPTCIKDKKYCPDLIEPDHGQIIKGECRKAAPGDKCKFKCNESFLLHGYGLLVCRHNLEWSHEPPECKRETRCPNLENPENGVKQYKDDCIDATYGDKCLFYCHSRFVLRGDALLSCTLNKDGLHWDYDPPTCRPKP